MHAHKLRAVRFTILLSALLVAATGCNRPRKVETKAEKQQPNSEMATPRGAPTGVSAVDAAAKVDSPQVTPDGSTSEDILEETAVAPVEDAAPAAREAAVQAELASQLKRLKFKARREIVAARTTIENIPSYTRSLEKFEREFEGWGMYVKVPLEPKFDELKGEITKVVEKLGLELLYYNILESKEEKRTLPEVIHGNKSFAFEENDVREAFQVTIRIARVPREMQAKLLAELKGLERLLMVRRFKVLPDSILINMEGYWFGEARYPLHQVLARDLQGEMQQLGITGSMEDILRQDTVGYLQNAALSYKELNASLPKINEAMGLLSKSKFLEARSAFFRKTVAAAAAASPLP
jgi:hypothetical protein